MTLTRTLLAVVLVSLPVAADWSAEQKGWALGTSAILTQMGNSRHDVLFGTEQSPAVERLALAAMDKSWGIHTRAELLDTIHGLLENTQDRARVGWNYPRAVNLARWGYGATFLSEKEAWNIIMPAAQRLQLTFGSWQELGAQYLTARMQWYADDLPSRRKAGNAYRAVVMDPNGPWRKYPWNLDLGNGQNVAPSKDKTAWLVIAAHPAGLICVRLGVPDHSMHESYTSAIEEAVGCRPRIKRESHNGSDWIVDTECVRPDTLQGAQVVAHFRLEPIATELRQEGVTQLFTYIENIPRGDSELSPEADDSWTADGWHYFITEYSLRVPLPDTTLTYGMPPEELQAFFAASGFFVSGSLLGAWATRRNAWAAAFPTLFWGAWIVVAVSFHGISIAGLRSGDEGLGADVSTLVWCGTGALLLRAATEFLLRGAEMQVAIGLRRTLEVSLLRSLTEIPFAIVLVLLSNPQNPLNLGTVIAMLALGAATAFVAWHLLRLTLGEKGGAIRDGELHDAVFAAARRMHVRLRRLYILPENMGPRVAPSVGSKGDLMIPERLLRAASRREIDGVVAYQLMLIKNRHLNALWTVMVPGLVILIWRAYVHQASPSENYTLIREAGIMISAFGVFRKSLGQVQSGAEKAFLAAGGDAEGWIAGVSRIGRLAGSKLSVTSFEGFAERCGIAQERVPTLMDIGFPETGHYTIPYFQRNKLESLS